MNKIAKISRRFRILFQFLFFFTPVITIVFWITFRTPYDVFSKFGIVTEIAGINMMVVNTLVRIFGIVVSTIPVSIIMYILYQLIQLMRNYQQGKIFTRNNTKRYRKLGYSLFAWVFGGIIYDLLITPILTFQNPPGQKVMSFSAGQGDLIALMAGGIVLLISWVMKEAHEISAEQKLTI